MLFGFRLQDLHLLRLAFQCHSTNEINYHNVVLQPQLKVGLASSPFARRYLGNH